MTTGSSGYVLLIIAVETLDRSVQSAGRLVEARIGWTATVTCAKLSNMGKPNLNECSDDRITNRIREVCRYLESHADESPKLVDLAARAGLSAPIRELL